MPESVRKMGSAVNRKARVGVGNWPRGVRRFSRPCRDAWRFDTGSRGCARASLHPWLPASHFEHHGEHAQGDVNYIWTGLRLSPELSAVRVLSGKWTGAVSRDGGQSLDRQG